MGGGYTTPPDAFTPELEALIAFMSGDHASARQWLARLDATQREAFRRCLAGLSELMGEGPT